MPTVLVPFKEFPGASHSAQSSVTLGTIYCWQSLECVFYPGSVRKEKMEKGYVQVTVSTTAERPWPWLFLVRSLPSKQPQETLCLPINSCSAHKQSENMSDCHELDKTCIALCVLILTFVILLRFYNTSNNPPNNKILQYQMEIKTPASQSVSTLSYVHCLDFSTACLQTAWPSSEELLKIKFRTETYQGSLKTQPRDSSISLEFEVFLIFFLGGGRLSKSKIQISCGFTQLEDYSLTFGNSVQCFTPDKGHLQRHRSEFPGGTWLPCSPVKSAFCIPHLCPWV